MQEQSTLNTVRFHGVLAKELDEEMQVSVSTPYQVLELMEANRPGLTARWLQQGLFVIYLNGVRVDNKTMYAPLGPDDELDFTPVVVGAGFIGIIAGIIAIVQAVFSLIRAFTKPPEADPTDEAARFQNPGNVGTEGALTPIVYGKTRYKPIRVSQNMFLGASSELKDTSPEVPYFNSTTTFWGAEVEFADELGGNPSLLSSETQTTQEVYILGEGEFDSLSTDDIYLNGTSLTTAGVYNFDHIIAEVRLGQDPQTMPAWIDTSAASLSPSVDTQLSDSRIVRTLNSNLDAARLLFQTLAFYEKDDKDQVATRVQLVVEKRVTGTTDWEVVDRPVISQKSFGEKRFEYTVTLDNSSQYDIAVSRTNEESSSEEKQDGVKYVNATEIQRDRVTYDRTAVLLLQYTNESFENEPVVEVVPKGKKVRVPSNYDPATRTYTGLWDGTYKSTKAWTDNPAWCIQDAMEDEVYGFGEKLTDKYNRFSLYSLAQFADVSVSDGDGGTEPRYSLNTAIQERKKAFATLRDLSSVFRGQPVWDGSEVVFFTEQETTASRMVNESRVVDGDFTYIGPSGQAKVNSITVSFQDKNNAYETTYINHKDHEDILANGLNEEAFEGVGCTSPGQALRLAKYGLSTEGMAVRFRAVEDWATVLPGTVFSLFDGIFMGKEDRQGLLSSTATHTTSQVVLDREFEAETGKTYKIWVTMPDLTTEIRDITNSSGTTSSTITVSSPFTILPVGEAAWGIEASDLGPQYYVAQSRKHLDDGIYEIDAIEFNSSKFAAIEQDVILPDDIPTTVPVVNSVPKPVNVDANVVQYHLANGARTDLFIHWERPSGDNGILGYDVYIAYNGGQRKTVQILTTETSATVESVKPGVYTVFVRSVTASARSSFETFGIEVSDGTEFIVGTVSGLQLFNQRNDTEFVNKDAKFTWVYNSPIVTSDFGSEKYGASSAYYDDFFKEFIIRVYDTTTGSIVRTEAGITESNYTYSLEKNVEDGGPRRTFRFTAAVRNKFNNESAEVPLVVSNPSPSLPNGVVVDGTIGGFVISYSPIDNLLDYSETLVWVSETSGFDPAALDPTIATNSNTIYSDIPSSQNGATRYVRFAIADTFGRTGLNYSSEFEVNATPVGIIDEEITFVGFTFSVTDASANEIAWTSGTAKKRDSGTVTDTTVSSGSYTLSGGSVAYIYWEDGDTSLSVTNDIQVVFEQRDRRTVAIYRGGSNFQQVDDGGGVLVSGDQLLAGTVGASQLIATTAVITGSIQIADGIVTNLKIGNIIQSNNWNSSTKTGWQIDKEGVIRGNSIEIYDGSGNLVFGSGTTINVNADGTISGFPSTGQVTLGGLNAGDFAFIDQITAANISTYMGSAAISRAYIQDGEIVNAKIGDTIQSSNWNSGSGTGWQINKNGEIKGRDIQILDNSGNILFGSGTSLTVNANGTITGFGASGQVTLAGLDAGDFAFLDQLTSGNITTYIASAAIPRALIGSAAIGSAEIDTLSVNTIHVANRAITSTTLKSKSATQTLSLNQDWQDVTSLVHTENFDSTSQIIFHVTVQFYCRVFDESKFSVDLRFVRGSTQLGPTLSRIGGKGDMDINAAPEDWYFSAAGSWDDDGTGSNSTYQVQARIQDPTEGSVNFQYPQSIRIPSGSMVILENFK